MWFQKMALVCLKDTQNPTSWGIMAEKSFSNSLLIPKNLEFYYQLCWPPAMFATSFRLMGYILDYWRDTVWYAWLYPHYNFSYCNVNSGLRGTTVFGTPQLNSRLGVMNPGLTLNPSTSSLYPLNQANSSPFVNPITNQRNKCIYIYFMKSWYFLAKTPFVAWFLAVESHQNPQMSCFTSPFSIKNRYKSPFFSVKIVVFPIFSYGKWGLPPWLHPLWRPRLGGGLALVLRHQVGAGDLHEDVAVLSS